MSTFPMNAIIANALAAAAWPLLMLLDRMNADCGDGLCGSFSGALLVVGLVVAVVVMLVRSARRRETPAALRFTPLLILAAILVPAVV